MTPPFVRCILAVLAWVGTAMAFLLPAGYSPPSMLVLSIAFALIALVPKRELAKFPNNKTLLIADRLAGIYLLGFLVLSGAGGFYAFFKYYGLL